MCCCFRFSNKSALVVTRILMAILLSHSLAIRWKPALGGSLRAGTNLGVCASPLGKSAGLSLARFPSLERAFPNGSRICARAVPRHRAQQSVHPRHRARLAVESLEGGRYQQKDEDCARPWA